VKGKLFGIGVGPGDPELITLKARRLLAEVPVICVPRSTADKDSIAFSIVREFVPETTTLVDLVLPMSSDPEVLARGWRTAALKIARYLGEGKDTAFITLGDSVLFSTFTYLVRALRELDPAALVETVPGVTSFSACAAGLNIALAEGNETLAVLPVVGSAADARGPLRQFDNIVLMKVAPNLPEVLEMLQEEGLDGRAVFASRCSTERQRFVFDLESLSGEKRDYLSLLLVKKGGFS
jgi:precorrin-2/cobalt-factor-2 C20-methyltransferase